MAPTPMILSSACRVGLSSSTATATATAFRSSRVAATSPLFYHPLQQTLHPLRNFQTTTPQAQKPPPAPPYPYGRRRLYKQSNFGLYGNARVRFGNHVSEGTEIINPQKNRRRWRVNVQSRRLWSEALQRRIRTRVTTRVLRTIDKVGGIDEYLLGSKPARIMELGPWGWRLRYQLMQTEAVKERFVQERMRLTAQSREQVVATMEVEAEAAAPVGQQDKAAAADLRRKIEADEEIDLTPAEGFMAEKRA